MSMEKNTQQIIESLYSPKKILIENQKPFIDKELAFREKPVSGDHPDNPYPNRWYIRPQWFLSMCYSIMESNRLKKEYEIHSGFKYDCVVRHRFDMNFLPPPINFSELDMQHLYAMRHSHNQYSFHDTFAFSNSENMDYYSDLFNRVDDYYKAGIEFCPEIMLGWHIINGDFKIIQMTYPFEIVR